MKFNCRIYNIVNIKTEGYESYSEIAIVTYDGDVVQNLSNNSTISPNPEFIVLKLTIGSSTASFNSVLCSLVVPAQILDGCSTMPIRFIAENLSATVAWNGETKQ